MWQKLRRFTKGFWWDTSMGTVFIFLLILFGGRLFNAFEVLNPVGEALADIEVTDIVFSRIRSELLVDPDKDVVLVNIGGLNREGIAKQIEIINRYEPKAIGIDAFFRSLKDPVGDSLLSQALSETKNLVMVSKLNHYNGSNNTFDTLETSHPLFTQHGESAFANLITSASQQEQFKICRTFTPIEHTQHGTEHFFAVKLAQIYDSAAASNFLNRTNQTEFINYRGNMALNDNSTYKGKFFALDWDQVLSEDFTADLIKDKIVVMGYLGEDFWDKSWEDKFFSPVNVQYAGKTNPDMYGAVIHANILSMIINGDYIDTMSEGAGVIAGIVLCFLNVALFTWIYRRLPHWYDGLTKSIQLLEALLLLIIIVLVFHLFNYKLNLTLGIIAVLLAGDSLEIYFGVIKNLFSKEQRRLLFQLSRDI
ncbi:MAG: CHASE2 domain-containing protein [Cyclobacteriaceae bacterium]